MFRSAIVAAGSAAVLMLAATAFAQQDHGTADEAKAMLTKTVSALKADKAKTIDLINEGKGGFLDRDLYPFCFNLSDGKSVAVASTNSKQTLGMDVIPRIATALHGVQHRQLPEVSDFRARLITTKSELS